MKKNLLIYTASFLALLIILFSFIVTKYFIKSSVTPVPSVNSQLNVINKVDNRRIKKEYFIKKYNGYDYKLGWMEIPIKPELDSPDNKDSISNAGEQVTLYKSINSSGNIVVRAFLFYLRGARFMQPCLQTDTELYFPEAISRYKEVCPKLKSVEVIVDENNGTDGYFEYLLNLDTGASTLNPF